MINITVNNKTHQFKEKTCLQKALQKIGVERSGIAIAVNQKVIPKNNWQQIYLNENDSVLIIKATQGG